MLRKLIAIMFAATLLGADVRAHDSPEHVIEDLTATIARRGPSPELLRQRANEYRIMRQLDLAAADLEHALKLESAHVPALVELARVRAAEGKLQQSIELLTSAIQLAGKDGSLYFERASIYAKAGDDRKALADCERAFKFGAPEIDWHLLRSQLLIRLGKERENLRTLKAAYAATGSVVLHAEWVESLIDARRFREALKVIEAELANEPRWRSSWLMRRGRARLGIGDHRGAHADFRTALDELNQRIDHRNPDLLLMIDRAMANALLGNREAARADYDKLIAMDAERPMLRRLQMALRSAR